MHNLSNTYWIKCRGLMRNMHVTALMGEFDWGHTNNTSETTTPNAKKTMSWRWNCKWGGGDGTFFRMQGKAERWGVMMQHSWTARPTCDRILYYYGDFSVALCFAPTVKNRAERKYRRKVITRWGTTVSREMFFKGWEASGSKCALCKKTIRNKQNPLQEVKVSHCITQIPGIH